MISRLSIALGLVGALLLFGAPASAAISYGNVQSSTDTSASDFDTQLDNYTVPAGSDRVLVVTVAGYQSDNWTQSYMTLASVTFDGQDMTFIHRENYRMVWWFGWYQRHMVNEVFYLNLGTGGDITSNIVANFADIPATRRGITAITLFDTHQEPDASGIPNAGGRGRNGSRTVTVGNDADGSFVVSGMTMGRDDKALTPTNGLLEHVDTDGGTSDFRMGMGTKENVTTGNTDVGWDWSGTEYNAVTAVSFEPVQDQAPVITVDPASVTIDCGPYTAVDALVGVTADDLEDGDLTGSIVVSLQSGGSFPAMASDLIVYTVTDSYGGSDTKTRTLTVDDTTPPGITALSPGPIEVGNGDTVLNASNVATASDNCSTPTVGIRFYGSTDPFDPSITFTCADAGRTPEIEAQAVDGAGNTATLTVFVDVQDTVPPTAPLAGDPIALSLDGSGQAAIAEADIQAAVPTASDTCGLDLAATFATVSQSSFSCTDAGSTIPVTVTFIDVSGNAATNATTVDVSVADDTNPVASALAGPIAVPLSAPTLSGNDLDDGSTDNCSIVAYEIDGETSKTFDCSNIGAAFQVTLTVRDASGNEDTDFTSVIIQDDVDPVAQCAGTLDLALDAAGAATIAVGDVNAGSTDNCTASGSLILSLSRTDFDCSDIAGSPHSVTLTVEDEAGNTDNCTVQVNVADEEPPVITLNGSAVMAITQGSAYTEPGATAEDNCDGSFAVTNIGGDTVDTGTLGTYTLTYDAVDNAGNSAIQVTREVQVVVDQPPVITLTGDDPFTLECSDTYTDPGATANDPEDGPLTPTIAENNVIEGVPGSYTVVWEVTDSNSTTVQEPRTVNVLDTVSPTLAIVGSDPVTVQCGVPYSDAGATASDICDSAINDAIVVDNPVDIDTVGEYTVRYNVSDGSGNSAPEVTRTVIVEDTTGPVLTLIGNATETVECGYAYEDNGAVAEDACEGDVTTDIVVTNPVTLASGPGIYTVRYNVDDSTGNSADEVTRTVIVSDTEAPLITLNGAATIVISEGDPFTDPGASVSDTCDAGVSVVVGGDIVDNNNEGSYDITYDAQDASGNDAVQAIRTVVVIGTGGPPLILTPPEDQSINYSESAEFEVSVGALGDVTYAWEKDEVPLSNNATFSGVTTRTLTVSNASNAEEGGYRCVATNPDGSTPSEPGILTVADPGIVQHPQNAAVAFGDVANFEVVAVGSGTLSYQWYQSPSTPLADEAGVIAGANAAILQILDAQNEDEGYFFVEVTGADGTLLSEEARLKVGDPVIVTDPVSQTVPPGTTVEFSVVAIGSGEISYRWRRNGSGLSDVGRLSGAFTPTLTISNVEQDDEANYDCRVLGENTATSSAATLTVGDPPVIEGIVVSPASGIVPNTGFFSLTVIIASGTPPFSYQWLKEGVPLSDDGRISGSAGPTLGVSDAESADSGLYSVIVASPSGSAESETEEIYVGLRVVGDLRDAFAEAGEKFTWRVEVAGGFGGINFQWMKDDDAKTLVPLSSGGRIYGSNTHSLTINPANYEDEGDYAVEISDDYSVTATRLARLTVVEAIPVGSGLGMFILLVLLLSVGGALIARDRHPESQDSRRG